MIRFSRMSVSDIPFAVKLSSQEDWGTPRSDLMRILHISPHGSFVAFEGKFRVGMITTVSFRQGTRLDRQRHSREESSWKAHRSKHGADMQLDYLKANSHETHWSILLQRQRRILQKVRICSEDAQFFRLRRPRKIPVPYEQETGKQSNAITNTLYRQESVRRRSVETHTIMDH